jgi:hypothetical protein
VLGPCCQSRVIIHATYCLQVTDTAVRVKVSEIRVEAESELGLTPSALCLRLERYSRYSMVGALLFHRMAPKPRNYSLFEPANKTVEEQWEYYKDKSGLDVDEFRAAVAPLWVQFSPGARVRQIEIQFPNQYARPIS